MKNDTDRLPPNSPEAEQGVLGAILLSPNDTLTALAGQLTPGLFYDLRHQTICITLLKMWEERAPIDVVTLFQRLKDTGEIDHCGGMTYVAGLPDAAPSAANAGYYMKILGEKHTLRRIIGVSTDSMTKALESDASPSDLLEEFEREALGIRHDRTGADEVDKKAVVLELTKRYEAAMTGTPPSGLLTGFPDFDRITGGLKPKQLIVIAGRPGKGKTSLAMNIAEHVSLDRGEPSAFVSLEMSGEELIHRLITGRAGVNGAEINAGIVTEKGVVALTLSAGRLVSAPLYIVDRGSMTIPELRGVLRRMVQKYGIKLGVVDYLGLLLPGQRTKSLYESVSFVSAGLKGLAKELAIPIIAPAQLNRDNDREGRAPRLSDLRDSGSIEQDADLVGLLHDGGRLPHDPDYGKYELRIAKHRNGPTGIIDLVFIRERTRFESAAWEAHN